MANGDIEFILNRDRTLFRTGAAAGTEIFVHIAGFLAHPELKSTHFTAHLFNLAVGQEIDFGMPTGIQQLGRENSDGAIVRGKGLVQLGHLAANARQCLHQVDLDTHLG